MLAMNLIGKGRSITDFTILSLAFAWITSIILFGLAESYWASEPIFPVRLLVNRKVISSYLIVFFQCGAQMSVRDALRRRSAQKPSLTFC